MGGDPEEYSCPPTEVSYSIQEIRNVEGYIDSLSDRKLAIQHYCYTVITNAMVVDVENGELLEAATIVLHDDSIVEITTENELKTTWYKDQCIQTIDASGKFLAPGLADMHVHYKCANIDRLKFLVNGVTTVRSVDGANIHLMEQQLINDHRLLGPTLYTTTPNHAYGHIRRLVPNDSIAKNWYWMYFSPYSVEDDVTKWLLVADSLQLHVAIDVWNVLPKVNYPEGTVFEQLTGYHFLKKQPNFDSFWFISKFALDQSHRIYSADIAPADGNFSEEQSLFMLPEAEDFLSNSRRICIGTEAGGSFGDVTGTGVHDEMQQLADQGLEHLEVIRMATLYPSQMIDEVTGYLKTEAYLGHPNPAQLSFGKIEPGRRADMVMLDANPLESVSNYKTISGVFVSGTYLSSKDLQEIREAIQKFDPQ